MPRTALNREYHLGRFAVPASAASQATPASLKALDARGPLNQQYRLGAYATPRHHVDRTPRDGGRRLR